MINELKKVWIRLPESVDGFPPFEIESVWAEKKGEFWRIDNIPFYAVGLSYNDNVSVNFLDGKLWYLKTEVYSKFSTLRVISYSADITLAIRSKLSELGCATEASNVANCFAVSVPEKVDYNDVATVLNLYFSKNLLDYEESSIRHGGVKTECVGTS